MTKKLKTHSEVEHLRGLVKKMKSELRHLKKELGHRDKKVRRYETLIEDAEDEQMENLEPDYVVTEASSRCPECGDPIEKIDLVIKTLLMCSCGFRRTCPK